MKLLDENKWIVVNLPDQLSQKEARELSKTLQLQIETENLFFLLDASKLTYLDSFAIGMLVQKQKILEEKSGCICFKGLRDHPLQLFQTMGLETIFPSTVNNKTDPETSGFSKESDIKFEIRFETIGDVAVFHLFGIMNTLKASRNLKEQYLLALEERKKFIFDLENLAYIDSHAVPIIIHFQQVLDTSRGKIRVCCANTLIQHLFEITGVNKVVKTYNNVDDALIEWKEIN